MRRARTFLLAFAFASAAALSCGGEVFDAEVLPPIGQVVLHVTTDAKLPPPPGIPEDLQQSPALFDQLLVEFYLPGESVPCADCSRTFRIDSAQVNEDRASIGFVPPAGMSGVRARVVLYRSVGAEVVGPRATSSLETVVLLPSVAAEGKVDVTASLSIESLGGPVGSLDEPASPANGRPSLNLAGTWEPGITRGCAEAPGEGEDAFPVARSGWDVRPSRSPAQDTKRALEKLTVLSPFYLDLTEATVGEMRASKVGGDDSPGQYVADKRCTYSTSPGPREDLPVNCASRALAERYCAKLGKRLPTEAELEYVGRALGRYDRFPWGRDAPTCKDAIHARSTEDNALDAVTSCGAGLGPAAVGTSVLDRVRIGDREVVDLAGNISEWVADLYNDEWEACFAAPIRRDPLCTVEGDLGLMHTSRGGNFQSAVTTLDLTSRYIAKVGGNPTSSGIRCARSAP